jgi:hypothetical protein
MCSLCDIDAGGLKAFGKTRDEQRVCLKAVFTLIARQPQAFMDSGYGFAYVRFRNIRRDKRGRLVGIEAFFEIPADPPKCYEFDHPEELPEAMK